MKGKLKRAVNFVLLVFSNEMIKNALKIVVRFTKNENPPIIFLHIRIKQIYLLLYLSFLLHIHLYCIRI
jgi:hypothetical protein